MEKIKECAEAISIASSLCIEFEGVYLKPYLCPARKPTIGCGATFYESGKLVTLSDPHITKERAMSLLHFHLVYYFLPKVLKRCPNLIKHQNVLGAALSFCFNVGVGRFNASTFSKLLKNNEFQKASQEILKWVYSGGVIKKGLIRRRTAESFLIFS